MVDAILRVFALDGMKDEPRVGIFDGRGVAGVRKKVLNCGPRR